MEEQLRWVIHMFVGMLLRCVVWCFTALSIRYRVQTVCKWESIKSSGLNTFIYFKFSL